MTKLRIIRRVSLAVVLLIAGLSLFGHAILAPAAETDRVVAVLDIEGAIGPATSDYVTRSLRQARELGATAVILRMDTPGGLASSMRDIIKEILASPVPIIGYVSPSGAHAASAGTYILYATHVAAMAPGTNLGAATPVQVGGGGPMPGADDNDNGAEEGENNDETPRGERTRRPGVEDKAVQDARAYIRSLAQLRGRNAEWAERAVTEAATLSAQDALEENVIDLVASSFADLLERADGRVVQLLDGEGTVETEGALLHEIERDWRTRLLGIITDPNIAYILLLVGFYGIILEFYNPGMIFSGVIGAICLVLGLFALNALPINYAGLALIMLGIAFMTAEAFMPSFGVLGIGGVVAFVIGSIILIDTDVPGYELSWAVIAGVAVTSAMLSMVVLGMAAKARTRPVVSGQEAMIGAHGRVIDWSGDRGHIRVFGEVWQARSGTPLSAGQEVQVTSMDGLVLHVVATEAIAGAETGTKKG